LLKKHRRFAPKILKKTQNAVAIPFTFIFFTGLSPRGIERVALSNLLVTHGGKACLNSSVSKTKLLTTIFITTKSNKSNKNINFFSFFNFFDFFDFAVFLCFSLVYGRPDSSSSDAVMAPWRPFKLAGCGFGKTFPVFSLFERLPWNQHNASLFAS
jgi:hypothetical protein